VDLVSLTLTQVCRFIDTSLGSVFLGRDIVREAEVALKMGRISQSPSRLNHEHNVYQRIVNSTSRSTSSVLWFGREHPYEVIVLEHLGNSLGDLVTLRPWEGILVCVTNGKLGLWYL